MSKIEEAYTLFEKGYKPADPEVKKLGIKKNTRYSYYKRWVDGHKTVGRKGDADEDEDEEEFAEQGREQEKSYLKATTARIVPKAFTMNASIIWQAQEAAENEWGWPHMEPGEFLDVFLYMAFKQRGVTLGGYTVEKEEQGNNGDEGDIQDA